MLYALSFTLPRQNVANIAKMNILLLADTSHHTHFTHTFDKVLTIIESFISPDRNDEKRKKNVQVEKNEKRKTKKESENTKNEK